MVQDNPASGTIVPLGKPVEARRLRRQRKERHAASKLKSIEPNRYLSLIWYRDACRLRVGGGAGPAAAGRAEDALRAGPGGAGTGKSGRDKRADVLVWTA